MKYIFIFAVYVLGAVAGCFAGEISVERLVARADQAHPRLLIGEESDKEMWGRIRSDPLLSEAAGKMIDAANEIMVLKPVVRRKIGRRLLSVSRVCLKRILCLATAYRMTGDERYVRRAEEEMLAASEFTDWNPSHFLDVAEMTAALAIGYDWLYSELSVSSRDAIRRAIIEKGLRPSLAGHHWWLRASNNWNQVCNAGMVLGALAIMEDEPDLAGRVIERSIQSVPIAMREYAPAGGYPEGPGYWTYGTSFNVIMIAALESALGTDFGLSAQEGFMSTADYFLHSAGPTGLFFNYSDGGENGHPAAAMYWFARRRGDRYLLWREEQHLRDIAAKGWNGAGASMRLYPLTFIWRESNPKVRMPDAGSWAGGGATPVAFHRSAWGDPDAFFIAVKGGSPATNHAHMDIGSFVLDAGGVRWAKDLGSQSYHGLESRGIDLWDEKQNGERWSIFRLNNRSHNTLVVDGKLQRVAGFAPIVSSKTENGSGATTVDLSSVYAGQLGRAFRTVQLDSDRGIRVIDRVETEDMDRRIRWGMVTMAAVRIDSRRSATLEQGGKRLRMRIVEPEDAAFRIYETEDPPNSYDQRNIGTRMIGFEFELPANEKSALVVELDLI